MIILKNLSPDSTASGGVTIAATTVSATAAKPNKKSQDPTNDEDWGALATDVNDYWKANSWITLKYITQPEFEVKAIAYNKELTDRQTAGKELPAKTKAIAKIEALMELGIESIKKAIQVKFEGDAKAQYSRYGVQHLNNGYTFPYDRNGKQKSLKFLIASFTTDSLVCGKYNLAFWTQLETDYTAAISAGDSIDKTVSIKVSTKNSVKAEVVTATKSIRLVIEGNHPNTFKAELRSAGWKKEEF